MKKLYPIFLNIEDRVILVVGGGEVSTRKIERLLDYKPRIRVISLNFTEKIVQLSNEKKIVIEKREFHPSDLHEVFIVIAATNNSALNKSIHSMCKKKSILVNAVDDPKNCDFFLPALITRDNLSIAVSTNGGCPGFAKIVRKKIESVITPTYGILLSKLQCIRNKIKENNHEDSKQEMLKSYLYSDICDDIDKLTIEEIEEKVQSCISVH